MCRWVWGWRCSRGRRRRNRWGGRLPIPPRLPVRSLLHLWGKVFRLRSSNKQCEFKSNNADVHWRAHITTTFSLFFFCFFIETTPFSLAAQFPGSSALISPNHCCLSALLEQLWQVPLWRGRWVGSLWALWSERLLCPNHWQLHMANADFHPDSVFVSLFRNALPVTYARSCATQYALQVNAHTVHILCRYVFRLLPPLWPDFCVHFLNRWPCGWTHWVPLSVNIFFIIYSQATSEAEQERPLLRCWVLMPWYLSCRTVASLLWAPQWHQCLAAGEILRRRGWELLTLLEATSAALSESSSETHRLIREQNTSGFDLISSSCLELAL